MSQAVLKKAELRLRARRPRKGKAIGFKPTKVTKGSGNVFADIGIPNAEEHLLKAELVRQIAATMEEQNLNQTAAAERLNVTQPDISKMLRGHFRQFSVERLMLFLVSLGRNVEIKVRRAAKDPRITVS